MNTLATIQSDKANLNVHPQDQRMLMLSSARDIQSFAADCFKGGIWEDAMSPEMMASFISLPDEVIAQIDRRFIKIDKDTGAVPFPSEMKDALPDNALDFIQMISRNFNEVGNWPVEFAITQNIAKESNAREFHLESESADSVRVYRAFIAISDTPEGQNHETEWIAADGLERKAITSLRKGAFATAAITDLPEIYANHALWTKSGDMFLAKGLGDFTYRDVFNDGVLHRAPPFKKDYGAQGRKRTSLMWQRHRTEHYHCDHG